MLRQSIIRDPDPQTQFPINTRPRTFDAWRLRDVYPDHVARIETLQPNSADGLMDLSEIMLQHVTPENLSAVLANRHPLAQLARLTNDDKHRILPGMLVESQMSFVGNYVGIDCEIVHPNHFILTELENGAKWAEIKVAVTGPEPKVQVGDRIAFADVSFGRCRVRSGLPEIGQAVTEVVREFESVF